MKLVIFVLALICTGTVHAKSSDLLIDHLTGIIANDCSSRPIIIKEGFVVRDSSKPVTSVNPNELRQVIKLFADLEPYDDYWDGCKSQSGSSYIVRRNGCGILRCGDHTLDINKETYYWNGVKVDVPRKEFKTVYGDNIETYGPMSPVTTGDNNINNQKKNELFAQLFLSKGTIVGAIIGLILKALYDIWKMKFIARKKSNE